MARDPSPPLVSSPVRLRAGVAAVLAALGLAWRAAGLVAALEPAPWGPAAPAVPCAALEVRGVGVGCVDEPALAARGLRAGDRLTAAGAERMAPGRLESLGVPIDPNRASLAELASLDGIGPGLAARLAAGRPYARREDLLRVRGIGRARLGRLAPRLALPP